MLIQTNHLTHAWLAREWLAIPPSERVHETVLDFLVAEREAAHIAEGDLLQSPEECAPILARVAHLIFSLPEAQLR